MLHSFQAEALYKAGVPDLAIKANHLFIRLDSLIVPVELGVYTTVNINAFIEVIVENQVVEVIVDLNSNIDLLIRIGRRVDFQSNFRNYEI